MDRRIYFDDSAIRKRRIGIYPKNSISVFGNISHFQLTFSGEIDKNRFEAVGNIADNPQAQIKIIGTKKEDL
jgi:hypothetical protein